MKFTTEQQAAIEAPLDPLLLVAGAGTGKTTVMAQRMLWLVENDRAKPDRILGLTFTNKAAFNLKEKVREALGPDAGVTIATYHSFGAGLVRDHALDLGLAPGTQLLDRAQAWQLLFTVFDEFRFQRRSALMPQVILDAALALATKAADYLVPIDVVEDDCRRLMRDSPWKSTREAAAGRLELCQVVAAYERRKRERNLLDYGDQVGLAVRLLETQPEVAAAERARHPVVLLDEYQDTNYAQRRLLELLYRPGSAITAVGDDMQSIYAFRGAHLFNILNFGNHFGEGTSIGATSQPLQITFRFGEPLATVANHIQSQVTDALPKKLEPQPGAGETPVECFLAADDGEEAATIADDVMARRERGEATWADHAVLCRKRRLIPAVVTALTERGAPVEVIGASGLLDRPEVVDLVAWIEVLADPGALVALLRILEGPRYRIGMRDLAALARHGRTLDGSLADALEDLDGVPAADLSGAARSRLADFRRERRDLAAIATRVPLLDLAETVVLHTGLWQAGGDRGRENLLRFLDLAERFAPVEGEPTLTAFVEYLQLLEQSEEDLAEAHESDVDAVRVMTIHQAKGLEFPVVYVPGLAGRGSSRIFPDDRAHDNAVTTAAALPWWLRADDEGLPDIDHALQKDIGDALRRRRRDEEWRLFYVACTRAQRRLVCSAAHWYPGPAEPQGPSEFYDFLAGLATDEPGLVTELFRHDAAAEDPERAAKVRHRQAAAARYAAPVASDPAQLRLEELAVSPAATAPPRLVPDALSVTGLVSYVRCPKQFYWSVVRPLPRRSTPAARLGTAVHRWIEQRSGRQLSLIEPSVDDPDALPADDNVAAALKDSFLASPWADLDPERVEAPFALTAGRHTVRGRVDAVYQRDGRLEVVDFKTGRRAALDDKPAVLQLNLYGVAAVDTWGADPDRLRTTYAYLRTDGPPVLLSADWTAANLATVREELAATLDRMATDRFDPTPGPFCRGCDFLPACPAGRRWVDG